MAFRIKKEYIGKTIAKGNETFVLSETLSDNEILYVKNMLSSEFVEQYDESKVIANKQVEDYISANKKKKDVDSN